MAIERVETGVVERDGEIIATGVSFEDYMEHYAANFCEWVDGVVIKMSPVSKNHAQITFYLQMLLNTYFGLRPIGDVIAAPFVMKLDDEKSGREPDLQVILNTNSGDFSETGMNGPADICIEVVSPESVGRDHGTKFKEYEAGGVTEYWIIDPLRNEARFYRLNKNKVYIRFEPDDGNYQTPQLPDFKLHVSTLWEDILPSNVQVVDLVKAMLEK